MEVFKNKKSRAVIFMMIALFAIGLTVNFFVRDYQNKSVDYRVVPARKLYEKYNGYAQKNQFIKVFTLMDSIEDIYSKYPHYKNSYETGVLYNNRAAVYLTLAIYSDSMQLQGENYIYNNFSRDTLFLLARKNLEKGIEIYSNWLEKYRGKNEKEVEDMIKNFFFKGLEANEKMKSRYLANRLKEIEDAQKYTKRRLSAIYTNMGVLERHHENYVLAAENYTKALDLWPDNLTAENNLNILLNKPLRKRSVIRKLFPKDRDN
jgi:tetratricopeptide (TPR) repeat protein